MMIKEIWEELLSNTGTGGNIIIRRYSIHSIPEIYIAVRRSTGERGFAISVDSIIDFNQTSLNNLKDIRIEMFPDEFKENNNLILILLVDKRNDDVFATLCTDLIADLSSIKQESLQVRELLNRLEKWKALFEMAANEGLTPAEQRGLFGELFFLRRWIVLSNNPHRCIKSWLGPEKALRDFQLEDWGIEVKTTIGNNHQKLSISSERQLDSTTLTNLILFHLSMEKQQVNGETLNELVTTINNLLIDDYQTFVQFNAKLLLSGYFDHHAELYKETGYQIRQSSYFHVKGNFPRIEEKDIRPGVGDVKYTIIISEQTTYQVTEDYIIEMIK